MMHRSAPLVTSRANRVLQFILSFCEERSYPPSYREIARACNLPSLSRVHYYVHLLAKFGYLPPPNAKARAIPPKAASFTKLPQVTFPKFS